MTTIEEETIINLFPALSCDIQHSTPQTLEGNFYGTVFCYMKKKI